MQFPRTRFAIIPAIALTLGACGGGERASPERDSGPAFTDVTVETGLGEFRHLTGARGNVWFPETMGSGGGFLDFDVDGDPDILLVGGGTWSPDPPVRALWLYRNRGDGTFEDATADAGLDSLVAYGMGVVSGDVDNDGDPDVYLTTVGRNVLLRNDRGVFRDATAAAGVGGGEEWSTAALFLDADRDGWLDLLVGNYVAWSPDTDIPCPREDGQRAYCTPELYEGAAPRFYRNRGDGTFEERTHEAGFSSAPGKTLGFAELDVNNDGYPDVAVANDTEADQLYVSEQGQRFEDRGLIAGIAFDETGKARAGMGIDAGDVDGDGRASIFVGNFSAEMISVFRHESSGIFSDRAAASGIGRPSLPSLTFGVFLFDADLDGDLDLFAANGHIDPNIERYRDNATFAQRSHLFLNDGHGQFVDHAAAVDTTDALAMPLVGRGAAYADIDADGDLDVLVTENGRGVRLWRNETRRGEEGPAWLRVHLQGTQSNRDGLGAEVRAVAGGRAQTRRVHSGGSYLSDSERTVTFGLGGASSVDSLLVRWPSGAVQTLTGIEANQMLELTEPASP